jgi:hypothetical protein
MYCSAGVSLLNVVLLNAIQLNIILQNFVLLNIILLNANLLNAIQNTILLKAFWRMTIFGMGFRE